MGHVEGAIVMRDRTEQGRIDTPARAPWHS